MRVTQRVFGGAGFPRDVAAQGAELVLGGATGIAHHHDHGFLDGHQVFFGHWELPRYDRLKAVQRLPVHTRNFFHHGGLVQRTAIANRSDEAGYLQRAHLQGALANCHLDVIINRVGVLHVALEIRDFNAGGLPQAETKCQIGDGGGIAIIPKRVGNVPEPRVARAHQALLERQQAGGRIAFVVSPILARPSRHFRPQAVADIRIVRREHTGFQRGRHGHNLEDGAGWINTLGGAVIQWVLRVLDDLCHGIRAVNQRIKNIGVIAGVGYHCQHFA